MSRKVSEILGIMNINELIKARTVAPSSYWSAAWETYTQGWDDKALQAKAETEYECNRAIHDHEKRCTLIIINSTPIDSEY